MKNSFYAELKQRAFIIAQLYLEEDEMEANQFKQVKSKSLQTLPKEVIRIYDSINGPAFVFDSTAKNGYNKEIIEQIRKEKYLEFEDKDSQMVGIYYLDNQGNFVIIVSAINENGISRLANLKEILIIGFILSLIIVYFTGNFFSRQVMRPMSNIIRKVNKITASNLHLRLNTGNGKDEISELAFTFNNMLNRLEKVFEMQKTFVQNASHELRTPLTSLILEIEVILEKGRSNEEYKETLKSILFEAEHLNILTTSLLNLANSSSDNPTMYYENIYMDDLLLEVKKEAETQVSDRVIKIQYINMPSDSLGLVIKGNKKLLHIAIFNIVENACKFSDNKEVMIVLECSDKNIKIIISDQGVGIPEKEMEKIFEPFYRASNAYNHLGSGIGLSLVKKIIELHKGKINVSNNPNGGTMFEMIFYQIGSIILPDKTQLKNEIY